EPSLTGSVAHIYTSFTTGSDGFISNYGVAWDQLDEAAQTFRVNFQIFSPGGSTGSPVELVASQSTVATATDAKAWHFRAAGTGSPYALMLAQHDAASGLDYISLQGYGTNGLPTTLAFHIQPDLTAYAPGATNQINEEPGSTLHVGSPLALQFSPNAAL